MQIKKEEVENALKREAKKQFLDHGFEKVSLRKIVKNAGTTLGNFYNYFDSKEALFASIVEQAYHSIIYVINNHQKWERNDDLWKVQDVSVWRRELLKLITPVIPNFTSAFVILIEGSTGTRFEHAKDDLIRVLSEHFLEHIENFNPNYENSELAGVLSNQLIFGLLQIIKSFEDEDIRAKLITEQILFFAIGTMGILKSEKSVL
ncbi:MAG: TetR/AcrR family transcriptional regulator [Acidaminobacteraceae bacterium]